MLRPLVRRECECRTYPLGVRKAGITGIGFFGAGLCIGLQPFMREPCHELERLLPWAWQAERLAAAVDG
jgi:hypothetical protein